MSPTETPPSVTSWQVERDALLDKISDMRKARDRTTDYLGRLASEVKPITTFDIGESLAILWENPEAPVLQSEALTDEEDQQ